MNTSYDVKFWETQRRTDRKTLSFLVRWTVARKANPRASAPKAWPKTSCRT
jgi:hypothetical protein